MRALRARQRDEAQSGFTMIELLVAMLLMSILGGILTTGMVNAMKVTRVQDDATRTLVDAKVAMELDVSGFWDLVVDAIAAL